MRSSYCTPLQVQHELATDVLRVGGRNCLGKFTASHPVNAHSRAAIGKLILSACRFTVTTRAAFVAKYDEVVTAMVATTRRKQQVARFKRAMSLDIEPWKSQSAEDCRRAKRRSLDVLDDIRATRRNQGNAHWVNQFGVTPFLIIRDRPRLARRRSMDDVELLAEMLGDRKSITLNEFKWIPRLRLYVDTDDLEACAMITHRAPAGPAKQVEQARLAGDYRIDTLGVMFASGLYVAHDWRAS